MKDWNKNGKYDAADSYVDYNLVNSRKPSAVSSDWWVMPVLAILCGAFPPLGIIIFLGVLIFG